MRTGIAVLHSIYVYIYTFTTVYQFWFACTYFAFFPQLSGVRLKLKVDAPTKLIFMTTDFCIRERELVNKVRGKVTLKHLLEWRVNRNLRPLIPLRVKHYPSVLSELFALSSRRRINRDWQAIRPSLTASKSYSREKRAYQTKLDEFNVKLSVIKKFHWVSLKA